MKGKIISLIERKGVDELKAYFDSMSAETPLDIHEELVLLENFLPEAVISYINRFRLSLKAEVIFIKKAPASIRATYINYYGLRAETQKHMIEKDMVDAARDFMQLRRFDDEAYFYEKASDAMVRSYLSIYPCQEERCLSTLLYRENSSLFRAAVTKDSFVSDAIKEEIIDKRLYDAFKAVLSRFYNKFKQASRRYIDFEKVMVVPAVQKASLSKDLQLKVLYSFDRSLWEILFRTHPLCAEAQDFLFQHNVDTQWLKLHVSVLYGMGGYRFTNENEPKLFKELSQKNLDDCLTNFRHRDDVSFVSIASPEATEAYVQNFWLSDDAQVALIRRKLFKATKAFVQRFSPEHGMCWQAEVEFIHLAEAELIKEYISFHTLCVEALEILKKKNPELYNFYFTVHPY